MDFIAELNNMDLPKYLYEAVSGAYLALHEANQNNSVRMPLPNEMKETIENGFRQAAREGWINKHAFDYCDRHKDMASYRANHDKAMALLEKMKQDENDVAIVAGPYCRFPDGSVRYWAYATDDYRTLIKLISEETSFPPTQNPRLRILTAFATDNPRETLQWLSALAKKNGKTIETKDNRDPNQPDRKTPYELARSRAKRTYSEMGEHVNQFRKDVVTPIYNQLNEELNNPSDQQDEGKIIELCTSLRQANEKLNAMIDARDAQAKKIFRSPRGGISKRVFTPLAPGETVLQCIRDMQSLKHDRFMVNEQLRTLKQDLDVLGRMPDDERDNAKMYELLKVKQDLKEQKYRIEEKISSLMAKVFGADARQND